MSSINIKKSLCQVWYPQKHTRNIDITNHTLIKNNKIDNALCNCRRNNFGLF